MAPRSVASPNRASRPCGRARAHVPTPPAHDLCNAGLAPTEAGAWCGRTRALRSRQRVRVRGQPAARDGVRRGPVLAPATLDAPGRVSRCRLRRSSSSSPRTASPFPINSPVHRRRCACAGSIVCSAPAKTLGVASRAFMHPCAREPTCGVICRAHASQTALVANEHRNAPENPPPVSAAFRRSSRVREREGGVFFKTRYVECAGGCGQGPTGDDGRQTADGRGSLHLRSPALGGGAACSCASRAS